MFTNQENVQSARPTPPLDPSAYPQGAVLPFIDTIRKALLNLRIGRQGGLNHHLSPLKIPSRKKLNAFSSSKATMHSFHSTPPILEHLIATSTDSPCPKPLPQAVERGPGRYITRPSSYHPSADTAPLGSLQKPAPSPASPEES